MTIEILMAENAALKEEVKGLKNSIQSLTNIIENDREEFKNILNEGYNEAFDMLQKEIARSKKLQSELDACSSCGRPGVVVALHV